MENGESQRKMLKYDFQRGRYYPSNGIIANVVHHDLDLYFKVHKISENHIFKDLENGERQQENAHKYDF